MTLGEKLKKLRTDKGLTRKTAAEQSGMSVATYNAYEDGRRTPTRNPKNYDKLAALFGCSVEYLKDDTTGKEITPQVEGTKKKTTRKSKAPVEQPLIHVELQYGEKAADLNSLVLKARDLEPNVTDLYLKPEENMAYYVAGDHSGGFELF